MSPPVKSASSGQVIIRSAGRPFGFDLTEHLDRLVEVRLEVLAHQIEYFDQHLVPQRVKDLIALLAVSYDLPAPQNGQMLRKVRLFDAQALLDSACRGF